jgi:peptidyl-prolyl cis-trans isomerase SurA
MKTKTLFRTLKMISAGIVLGTATPTLAQSQALDTVIAIVDDDVVMASELQQRMGLVMQQIRASQTEAPPEEVIRRQLLEQLILESLQLQMASRVGVEISDAELDQAIARIAQSRNVSEQELLRMAAADGLSANDLRAQIRRDMILDQVQTGSVNRRIHISEQEVDNFLASKQGELFSSPDYLLGHLFLAVPSATTEAELEQIQAKADSLYQQLQDGADFRALAMANSADESALQGGDLGWRKTAQIPELFADALHNAQAGFITAPLRSGAGFHILKVHDLRGAQQQIISQAKVRHILVKPSTILSDEQARQKLLDLRQQALNGTDFAELARANSEDIGSMLSGGDLGWSLPGQFVPEFEATMDSTATGAISPPFRSQFGWHILQVVERRQQDMSEEVKRNQARNQLRKRRFEEERINWLQEIRDQAFVEIKS